MLVVLTIVITLVLCWLIDKGFDILQTDWTMSLRHFIDNRK